MIGISKKGKLLNLDKFSHALEKIPTPQKKNLKQYFSKKGNFPILEIFSHASEKNLDCIFQKKIPKREK